MDGPREYPASLIATLTLLGLGLAPLARLPGPVATLHRHGANRADVERQQHGYYETLLALGGRPKADAGSQAPPAGAVPFEAATLATAVPDLRQYALKPGVVVPLPAGGYWTTNAQGRHDAVDAGAPAIGQLRVALLGDSIGSAWGVADADGFGPRAIVALDAQARAAGGPGVELLNYAVPGHAPGQRWEDFVRQDGWSAAPVLVLYEATPADLGWDAHRLRGLLEQGVGFDAPQYAAALAAGGIAPGGDFAHYRAALKPIREAILANVYRTIVAGCRARGVPAAWVLVPRVGEPSDADPEARATVVRLARAAGFDPVIDLSDRLDGVDPSTLAIGPGDYHPNAAGHARLAEPLATALAGTVLRPGRPAAPTRPIGGR